MLRTGIMASQLIKRLVTKDAAGRFAIVAESPDFGSLPDWVTQCYLDTKFFVSCDDDYTGLWVALPIELPYEHDERGVAIRVDPSSLLLYDESEGFIRILADIEY